MLLPDCLNSVGRALTCARAKMTCTQSRWQQSAAAPARASLATAVRVCVFEVQPRTCATQAATGHPQRAEEEHAAWLLLFAACARVVAAACIVNQFDLLLLLPGSRLSAPRQTMMGAGGRQTRNALRARRLPATCVRARVQSGARFFAPVHRAPDRLVASADWLPLMSGYLCDQLRLGGGRSDFAR